MLSNFKLPFSFDLTALQHDLDQVALAEWTRHFNTGYYEGEWAGVALRSVGGVASRLYPDPMAVASVADTPILDRCPNVRALLALFKCPVQCVRFLRLTTGSKIREHQDYGLGYEEGQIRLHVPVLTNAEVDFYLDAHRIEMKEGECWYLDLSLPHWVENRGASDRVHLVVDCEVNDWLRELLAAAESSHIGLSPERTVYEGSACSTSEWERFRQTVFTDPHLQERLRATADPESFTRLVVSLGSGRGFRFNATDVEAAISAARAAWIQKWID